MKSVSTITGAFALAMAAQTALAADIPTKAPTYKVPVAATMFNWTGWYGGVNAGVGISQTRAATVGLEGSFDRTGVGFTGGVQGGYNWQFNPHWVAGIEGDFGWLGIDRSFENFDTGIRVSGVKTDWYGTIRGRLGYTNSPSLFYVTGGAAFVNVRNNADDVGATPLSASRSEIATGWTVGGGIETMLGGNWSAKAEYLFINAGSQDVFQPEFGGGELINFDNRFHMFKFGLNHRFGGPGMPATTLPSYNWAGFYLGVYGGTGLSQGRADAPTFSVATADIGGAGFTGGVQAGYNWQISPVWVAGIEGDFGWLGIDRSFQNWDSIFTTFGVQTDWYGTVRGRVGYSTGPALLYVTGGAAWVKVANNFDRLNPGTADFASKSEIAAGWTAGGGIEAALAQNWTAKIEYLYIDAGSQDVFNPTNGTARFDNRFHVFRFGLNYQFAIGKAPGPVMTKY